MLSVCKGSKKHKREARRAVRPAASPRHGPPAPFFWAPFLRPPPLCRLLPPSSPSPSFPDIAHAPGLAGILQRVWFRAVWSKTCPRPRRECHGTQRQGRPRAIDDGRNCRVAGPAARVFRGDRCGERHCASAGDSAARTGGAAPLARGSRGFGTVSGSWRCSSDPARAGRYQPLSSKCGAFL